MMTEWGIPFDHIENNWTDGQYMAMAEMLSQRLRAESDNDSGNIDERAFLRKTRGTQHGWSSG